VLPAAVTGPPSPPIAERTVGDLLRRAVTLQPDRAALVEGASRPGDRRRWTYRELLADAEACARALLAIAEPGNRIAVWAPNIPEYQVLQYGIALAGMVMVTVNPAFRAPEVRYAVDNAEVAVLFAAARYRDRELTETAHSLLGQAPQLLHVISFADFARFLASADPSRRLPDVDPAETAQILFTSGTTGQPKGAMLSHRAMTNNVAHAAEIIKAGPVEHPTWLASLPMFHLASCVVAAMGTAFLAGTLVTVEQFDARLVLRLIEEERITMMNQVPTLVMAMLSHPDAHVRDLTSLHSVMLGGATIPPELVRELHARLGTVSLIGYGMTEAAHITITRAHDTPEDKAGTCGLPLPHVEVRIRDPRTGEDLSPGEVGEVVTRGFHVMRGYYRNPAATSSAIDEQGWLHTGDLGSLDERGYLQIRGRLGDMIIRGGENVYPREIEERLQQWPGIEEAAVVGLPDDYYGEIVAAFVRLGPAAGPLDVPKVTASLREDLTGYKIPAKWFVVGDFPRTPSGKIRKFEIRDTWGRGDYVEERS